MLTCFHIDGVHVIHQLTQAGRTLVAVLLCCKSEALQHLIQTGLDALRSCIGLLRRFSGRYVCGLRSGDLMEEFCRRKLPSHQRIQLSYSSSSPAAHPIAHSYQYPSRNRPPRGYNYVNEAPLDSTSPQEGFLCRSLESQ